jgi:hypothetical protein
MLFSSISLQSIKSDTQRALAAHWDSLAAGRRFPAFTEFALEPAMHDPKQLVAWNVERGGTHLKFRALYQGENVAEAFSSAWAGRTMDEVVPISLRRITLDPANECAASGCAIYTVVSTMDSNERQVDCERLLLPFGPDGARVEQILASLQLTSIPGGFLRRKILKNFQMHADVLFSGKVESGSSKTSAASRAPDVHEFPMLSEPEAAASRGHRRAARRDLLKAGRIVFGNNVLTCTVRNISATGAAVEGANLVAIPDTFTLIMEMETAERPCTVVWRKQMQIGVRFG